MTEPDLLQRVLGRLVLRHPFLASLALRLTRVEDPTARTAWTDGVHLAVNPTWFAQLGDEERLSLVAHECYHVALGHHLRRGSRDLARWNQACDYAINALLVADGFTLFPKALHDPVYGDACAEVIFNLLPPSQEDPSSPACPSSGTSGTSEPSAPPAPDASSPGASSPQVPAVAPEQVGEVRDLPSQTQPTPGEQQERLAQHAILITALAQQARAAGSDSAGARRAQATALETGTVDWRALLLEFLSSCHQQDFSWHRPNPRYAPLGLYLPCLVPAAPGRIAFVVDTSGSVSTPALNAVAADLEDYLRLYPAATLDLLYADAAVKGHATYTAADLPLRLDPVGGGGTDFGPALAELAAAEVPPACVVYLTDLRGFFPKTPPPMPVLWLVFGASARHREAPFGRIVCLPY